MDHHNHDHHAVENSQKIIANDESCCSGTDAPESSGQHMMHHMMSVSMTKCVQ